MDTPKVAKLVEQLQTGLLFSVKAYLALQDQQLSSRVADAFSAVPRHQFVERYRHWESGEWRVVDETDPAADLPLLYRDSALGIAGQPGEERVATISRPGVVLAMLELLDVQPGQRVLEIGAGSGWNAALLGRLVGPEGYVESHEIIPELAARAERVIARAGMEQVRIVSGDAAELSDEPTQDDQFDRVIFTTGAYDIALPIFERIRVGALCLGVVKFAGGGDAVVLFRRHADHLASITARQYEFVAMTGATMRRELGPVLLQEFAPYQALHTQLVAERAFPCGGRGDASFAKRSYSFRTYLEVVEPRMCWFVEPRGWPFYFFGLWDPAQHSLAIARQGQLLGYGNDTAVNALLAHLHDWVDLGFPSAVTMPVRAYRAGEAPPPTADERMMRRPATDFVWSTRAHNPD
jgi:protein-L-isoaspartate(D-aspartate) O-methyltransferase